jgi:uncharacterized protein
MIKRRDIAKVIAEKSTAKHGRILVLTGARQTGKTTLVKHLFPTYNYISVEDPQMRGQYLSLTAAQWKSLYPNAILDEVQKEPSLIESIKSVYDQWDEPRYVLLGSSQLLLLEKVRESLAGRCQIIEVFPLTLPELRSTSWDDPFEESMFVQFLKTTDAIAFLPSFLMDSKLAEKTKALAHYIRLGGYPALSDDELTDDERYDWLHAFVNTYLERDIRDLASFRDLEPFVKTQRYVALNTGNMINASSIAVQVGLTSKTVQRYLHYFELSYQAIILQPWFRNGNKRLVKTPKIHFMDNGIVQSVLQKSGGLTGNEFESLIVAEVYKQAKNARLPITFYHLRTQDGREVDLLLETADYYIAIEIKMTQTVTKADAKHLLDLDTFLDKPLRHSFIISNDTQTKTFGENITALHAGYFLG